MRSHTPRPAVLAFLAACALLASAARLELLAQESNGGAANAEALPAPADFLGHAVGADFRLAPWDTVLAYLESLADASPAISVDRLGTTTLGAPFAVATITSPRNFARLDSIKASQARLADPRGLSDEDLEHIALDQPAVVLIAHNLHSTEIASSQGSMELAHALVSDPSLTELLDDVVVLLVPSANPDGQKMVVDWYRRTAGTPYEGSRLPWLYHHYAGHDNNRDWFMLNLTETRMVTRLLYDEWYPEVVYDVHQMGNRGARFFVPPFDDPLNPNIDPLLVRMISLFGIKISTDLEAAGKSGVVNYQTFDLWWHGGNRSVPTRHNMVGILSETASARYASPIFQEADQLRSAPEFGVNYPNPWHGGWWRIRDILDYQMIAARAIIGLAARQRGELIRNYVELGRRALRAGELEPPYAYIVPARQTDPGSAARLLEILRLAGVEVHRAESSFTADGVEYGAGSSVVLMAQPYRAHAKDLLERQEYPDRRAYPGGPPDRPYDVSGWTLPLQMGVEAIPAGARFDADLILLEDTIRPRPGSVRGDGPAYAVDYTSNAASLAIHAALRAGGDAVFLSEPASSGSRTWPVGTAIVRGSEVRAELGPLAEREGVTFETFDGAATGHRLSALRVGLYQSWTASMDEGWTRFVFDKWQLPYETIRDAGIRAGALSKRFDVIVVPSMSRRAALEGRGEGTVPSEYAGGLGRHGVEELRAFVRDGGTLICLGESSELAIEELDLPVKNVRPSGDEQRAGSGFYAPGSVLLVDLDTIHPLGYGMPDDAAVYYANGPIFEVESRAEKVTAVARYAASGVLLSGYALNSDSIAGKAALVEAELGDGRVILFSFRPQHRGQSHETFKVLFNAVYRGAAARGNGSAVTNSEQ